MPRANRAGQVAAGASDTETTQQGFATQLHTMECSSLVAGRKLWGSSGTG